jgi:uncharacterized protein (TIGR02453 family)
MVKENVFKFDPKPITMLKASTFQFIKDLKANNNKEWFDANRKIYQIAKDDFLTQVQALITELEGFDPEISIAQLDPKKCIFRINRDTRFSTDKSPYKTNMGAWFSAGAKGVQKAGYYLHVEDGGCFLAGGLYMPETEALKKIRQEIHYNHKDLVAILNEKSFKQFFPKALDTEHVLKKAPQGYKEDNPAIDLLKLKSFTASHSFEAEKLLDAGFDAFAKEVFSSMYPLIKFLNQSFD